MYLENVLKRIFLAVTWMIPSAIILISGKISKEESVVVFGNVLFIAIFSYFYLIIFDVSFNFMKQVSNYITKKSAIVFTILNSVFCVISGLGVYFGLSVVNKTVESLLPALAASLEGFFVLK